VARTRSAQMELIAQFVSETMEFLEEAETALVAGARGEGTKDTFAALFRAIHTIKGSASYLGFSTLTRLTHAWEQALGSPLTSPHAKWMPEQEELFFQTLDLIKAGLHKLDAETGENFDADYLAQINEITQQLNGCDPTPVAAETFRDPGAVFQQLAAQHLHDLENLAQQEMTGDGPWDAIRSVLFALKQACDYAQRDDLLPLILAMQNELKPGVWQRKSFTDRLQAFRQKLLPAASATPTPTGGPATPLTGKRVSIAQQLVDDVMNLTAELLISRNRLAHTCRQVQELLAGQAIAKELKAAFDELDHISDDLQSRVHSLSLIEMKDLFRKARRLVVDLERQTGKPIQLQLMGESSSIDKALADRLWEPLLHIIRNAADHGLETPTERRQSGKTEQGLILIKAEQLGQNLILTIRDDGRGIDHEKLIRKAVQQSFLTEAEATGLDRAGALRLIFLAGLSSRDEVSAISGRGVGMDAVQSCVQSMQGRIAVESVPGQGTTFTITLPTRTSTVEALLVEADATVYALPIQSVRETLRVESGQLRSMLSQQTLLRRDRVIPLRSFSGSTSEAAFSSQTVVISVFGDEEVGILVDRVHGRRSLVTKPLPVLLRNIPGLSGASILGDGRSILILDPQHFPWPA
jgi:two-component system chemotaxis sensor kinase CheA